MYTCELVGMPDLHLTWTQHKSSIAIL